MKKYLLTVIPILFRYSLLAQQTITLHVDPDNSRGGTSTEIFDSIIFIPLETTKESLFGSIDQLEVTDSLLIILDISGRSMLFFNRNGTFRYKVTTGGIDKYFYYFAVDRLAKEIIVTNNYAKGLLIYDWNGKFLRKEPCPEEILSLYIFSGGNILYNRRRKARLEPSDHTLYDLAYSKGYDSITKNLNPYNARNEDGEFNIGGNTFNFSGEAGSCMFSLPYDYTIYQLNDTGIVIKYRFIFPLLYSLPVNFSTDAAYRTIRAQNAYLNPGYKSTFTALERGYKYGEYLLFSAFSRRTSESADYNFAYSLHSGTLISFSRVTADSSSYFLPILSGQIQKIEAIYKGNIFSSIPGFRLFSVKSSLDKKVAYPKALEQYFKSGNRSDNSVI